MRDIQPPITNNEELAGYRAGLAQFNEIVASFGGLRQLAVPGELWAYCSAGFMLASRVVEVVTG